MKTITPELRALFDAQQTYAMADLLTITPVGAAAQRLTSHDSDLSFGGNTWVASGVQPHSDRPHIKHSGTASGTGNLNSYRRFAITTFKVLPTDIFIYDVLSELGNPAVQCGIDFRCSDNTVFRSAVNDQNGLSSHPTTNIAAFAKAQWYSRRFSLAAFAGKTISTWATAFEADTNGSYVARFANIRIVDEAGNTRLEVWRPPATSQSILGPVAVGTEVGYTGVAVDAVIPTKNPLFKRGGTHVVRGIEVDTNNLDFYADLLTTLLGASFIPFAAQGGLDGARVVIERAYAPDWLSPITGTLQLFSGRVSEVAAKRNMLKLTQKSDLEVLDVQSPRNEYQPACLNTLFDGACGLSKAAFSQAKTATAGSTISKVNASIAEASGWFDQGTLAFTAGANAGIARTIKSQVGGVLTLILPLPFAPATGDAFSLTPGCNKAMSTCASAKFNNLLRFRGFPFLPKPETGTTGPNLRESAEGYGGSPGFEGGGVVIPRGLQTPVVPVRL